MDLKDSDVLPRHCDGSAEEGGGGSATVGKRTEDETLEYLSELVIDLRELAAAAGWERLATLLALTQYEVRGLLAKSPANRVTRP